MIQQALKTSPAATPLRVIKTGTAYREQLNELSHTAWLIAYTALWNGETFSAPEKEKATGLLKDFIKQQANPKKAFSELVQRILLARQYILTHPGTYAPIPTVWLNPDNKNGFSGTHRWWQSVEESRKALPLYKQSMKAFAEAILEIRETNSPRDFHYWRNYFAEQNAQATLNLFLATLANCRYSK